MLKKVSTSKAPIAIGTYLQAIIYDNFIFTSGQIAINPETVQVAENDIIKQTEQFIKKLNAVLIEVGSSFDKVIKTI